MLRRIAHRCFAGDFGKGDASARALREVAVEIKRQKADIQKLVEEPSSASTVLEAALCDVALGMTDGVIKFKGDVATNGTVDVARNE